MAETKLIAVNMCLAGIGIAPVATEDEDDLDAAGALSTIERLTGEIQSKGLWFNKEPAWNITPDPVTGYVAVPGAAISVEPSGSCRNLVLSQRGNKMYDMYNHTFDLRDIVNSAGAIEFTIIMKLSFEDIPEVVRTYVAYAARRMFAQDSEVDSTRWQFQKDDEKNALIAFQREDARQNKRNYITDNYTIQTFLNDAGGPNAYTTNVGVFPRSTYE